MTEPANDEITVVREPIPLRIVRELAEAGFGDLVKAVVDIDRQILAMGGDLHSDAEAALLDLGCRQADLWGINLYPGLYGRPGWVEYDSLINIRPTGGNRSRLVEAIAVRKAVDDIVDHLVQPDA